MQAAAKLFAWLRLLKVAIALVYPVSYSHIKCESEQSGATCFAMAPKHTPSREAHQAERLFAAQVPMTVIHRTGLPLDGSHPALMTVYGAYGLCLETGFEPERLALLDRGWVIALAHVRGGGELGRRWVELAD